METPKLSPAKINPTKLLPGISISEKKISTQNLQEESISVIKSDLFIIKKQVFKIRDLIQTSTLIKQSELEKKRKSTEKKEAEEQENKLEAKPEKKEGKLKMPSAPKLGFLDRIKNFLFSILLGYISIKLLPHLPKLVGIVSIIGNVMEFMIDLGGNILDKVVTFIDWGYKAIDATRGFMKSFGGDFSLKIFDTFTGAVGGVIDAAIIASIAVAGQGKGGVLDIGMDLVKDRLVGQGAKTAAQAGAQAATGGGGTAAAGGTAAQAGGIGTGAVAAIILGAGLLASALGEGAFQLKKMSVGMEQGAKKAYDGEKNPLMKPIRWLMYQGAKFISFQLGTVGTLLDIVGTPFRYAIELIRYPFLDEKGKEAQSKNLAKFDARIREQFREGLNALTFGLVGGGGKGSFGSLFGDKGTKGMGYAKQAEGGPAPVTRGNKIVGGAVKRTISRRPVKRGVKVQVTKVKPGGSIGGKKKLEKIFPEVPTKDKGKNVNPLGYMQSSYNIATKTPSFGALFALPLKAQLGEKPSSVDYMKAAEELSGWMQNTFRGTAGYAGGGKVEAGMFGGDDTTNVIAKSLEENISSKVDAAIKELQKQLMLKEGEKKGDDKKTGPDGGGDGEITGLQGTAKEYYDYLISKGVKPNQALGLVLNLARESSYNPAAYVIDVNGKPSGGLFQWNDIRFTNMTKDVGSDWKTDWKGQLDYALKENDPQSGGYAAYAQKNFSSPMDAATWWLKYWERGNDVPRDVAKMEKILEGWKKQGMKQGQGPPGVGPESMVTGGTMGVKTSGFGWRDGKMHTGIDIDGGDKSPISSSQDATVVHAGFLNDGFGNSVILKYSNGAETRFAHLDKINVRSGQKISPSQLIGTQGNTGASRGSHLHFEYFPSGNAMSYSGHANPENYVNSYLRFGGSVRPKVSQTPMDSAGKPDSPIGKVIRSFKVANDVFTEREGGKYFKNGKPVDKSYYDAVFKNHVAYAKGGRVNRPTFALIGEKGKEFIFDANTTSGLDAMVPYLLDRLNAANTKREIMRILQSYAGYEDGAEQTVIVMNNPQMVPIPIPTGNSGSIGGMSRSSSIDTTYDIQYANA